MKRKVLTIFLVGMLAITAVTGCGNKNTTDTKKETTATTKTEKEEYKTIGEDTNET